MTKDENFAQVKIEDLKKTYDEECDDVKRVLRKMYPKELKKKIWVNVTKYVTVEKGMAKDPSNIAYISLYHGGEEIGQMGPSGFEAFTTDSEYRVTPHCTPYHFKVEKKEEEND